MKELEDLEDYLEKIQELHAVFNPENQKDFVIDRILQYVYDSLRTIEDILEALKEKDEWLASKIRWVRDDLQEIAERLKEEEE